MEIKKSPKISKKYVCEICDFKCCRKTEWDIHVLRPKHKNRQNVMEIEKNSTHICVCKKEYKTMSGLWKHKKRCSFEESVYESNNVIISKKKCHDKKDDSSLTNLIIELVKSNTELQQQMLEVCKNGTTTNNINNSMNNSHNKTFNLQVFLNETCKDAMNIMEFVDSIKFQLSDLESVGELGYIKGISNIIIKNLNALDENMRPVHCVDLKRERIYVKDGGKWEKECPDYKILKNAIKYIAQKNVDMIPAFEEKYPDCHWVNSMRFAQYVRLSAIGGEDNDEDGKVYKIISKIAKEILIEKKIW